MLRFASACAVAFALVAVAPAQANDAKLQAAVDGAAVPAAPPAQDIVVPDPAPRGGPSALRRIDTRPVGFAVFDRVLLSVHPQDNQVRDTFAKKLMAVAAGSAAPPCARSSGWRRWSASSRGPWRRATCP